MGEDDSGDKTEEPTPHKLQEARKKGQIAKSKDVTTALMLIVSFFTLKATAAHMWEQMVKVSYMTYDLIPGEFSASVVGHLLLEVLKIFFMTLGPMFGATFLTALVVELIQTGFLVSGESIMPKLEKLNPLDGFKKFFTMKQYIELVKSMAKMAVVIYLIYGVIKEEFIFVIIASQMSLWQVMVFTGQLVMKVIVRVGIFYILIAAFDYMYQRWEFMKSMKMSKKEIKDEYKRLEGDPLIKQRQRDTQRQMASGRQMGAVPGADVVVTNPIHLAIAFKYDPKSMKAPKIIAKGKRLMAQEIKRIAAVHFIPIIENPVLARALYPKVEVDKEVPPEFFKAIAEVLAFVYNLKRKTRSRWDRLRR